MKGSSPIFIKIDHCDPFLMVPFSEIHLQYVCILTWKDYLVK
jgi:hypothetical protein